MIWSLIQLGLLLSLSPCVLLASHLNKHFHSWLLPPALFAKLWTPGARLAKVLSDLHCKQGCWELCLQHQIMGVPGTRGSRNPGHSWQKSWQKFPPPCSLSLQPRMCFASQDSLYQPITHLPVIPSPFGVILVSKLSNKAILGPAQIIFLLPSQLHVLPKDVLQCSFIHEPFTILDFLIHTPFSLPTLPLISSIIFFFFFFSCSFLSVSAQLSNSQKTIGFVRYLQFCLSQQLLGG